MPVCKSENATRSSNVLKLYSPVSQVVEVDLPKASSTTNATDAFRVMNIKNELDVFVNDLTTSTSCNLGFTNLELEISVAHMVNMVKGDHLGVLVDPEVDLPANIAVRASTYVQAGTAILDCEAW